MRSAAPTGSSPAQHSVSRDKDTASVHGAFATPVPRFATVHDVVTFCRGDTMAGAVNAVGTRSTVVTVKVPVLRAEPACVVTVSGPVAAPGGTVPDRLRSLVTEWVRERVRAADGAEPAELYQALLDAAEPALLDEVLRQLDGNRLAAARWLGLARATVRKMIRKYHPTTDEPDGDEA